MRICGCLLARITWPTADIQFDRMVENGQEVKELPWIGVGFEDGSSYMLEATISTAGHRQQVAYVTDVPNSLGMGGGMDNFKAYLNNSGLPGQQLHLICRVQDASGCRLCRQQHIHRIIWSMGCAGSAVVSTWQESKGVKHGLS